MEWEEVLNKHDMFIMLHSLYECHRSVSDASTLMASPAPSLPINQHGVKYWLVLRGNQLLAWNEIEKNLVATNLLNLQLGSDKTSFRYQVLLCDSPPTFSVNQLMCNGEQLLALIGNRGISVLELPKVWGKYGEFDGGKSKILCHSVPVAERLLVTSPRLQLLQAAWHPASNSNTHLLILTSDNYLRLYNMDDVEIPESVYPLSDHMPSLTSNKYSVSESAISFSIYPQTSNNKKKIYKTFILYGNGDVYWLHTDCKRSSGAESRLRGPLHMQPAADDNYGVDACSILTLPTTPPLVAVTTSTGVVYHSILMESGEVGDDEPCLHVLESVQLELSLSLPEVTIHAANSDGDDDVIIDEYDNDDFATAITLHPDSSSPYRYHCSHAAGVHTIVLPWLQQLEDAIESDDTTQLSNLFSSQSITIVEHVLCTKPLPSRNVDPMLGFHVTSSCVLGTSLICLTSDYRCIVKQLLPVDLHTPAVRLDLDPNKSITRTSPLKVSAIADDDDDLSQTMSSWQPVSVAVKRQLQRVASNPIIRLQGGSRKFDSNESLQLYSRSIQILKEEYLNRQKLTLHIIKDRLSLLTSLREQVASDLKRFDSDKEQLINRAGVLAERHEEMDTRQQLITNRLEMVIEKLQSLVPVMSEGEERMLVELEGMKVQMDSLQELITQAKLKKEYQDEKISTLSSIISPHTLSQEGEQLTQILEKQSDAISELQERIDWLKIKST